METFSLNIYPSTYVSKNAIKRKKKKGYFNTTTLYKTRHGCIAYTV